jgi:4-hydroxy-tetrahydrodipicolinate synthase
MDSTKLTPSGRLRGIFPPLVTPLTDKGQLEADGLERLLEHVLDGGVQGAFLLGTTGEAPHLSHSVRRELVQRACRTINGRCSVLVGISDTSKEEAVSLAQFAAECGANGVVAAPPYYFPLSQDEIVEFMRQVAAEIPLPLLLYNMPRMTKVPFSLEVVRRLMSIPRIVGVKDSSGDLDYFSKLLGVCRERPDWSVFIGPEQWLGRALGMGADGGICGGGNIHPKLFVEMFDAAVRGDAQAIEKCERTIVQLGRLYHIGQSSASVTQGLNAGLSLLGICGNAMSVPFSPLEGAELEQARQVLAEIGILKSRSEPQDRRLSASSAPPPPSQR